MFFLFNMVSMQQMLEIKSEIKNKYFMKVKCLLSSIKCLLFSNKCLLFSNKCLLFSNKCLSFSSKCLLFSLSSYKCFFYLTWFQCSI